MTRPFALRAVRLVESFAGADTLAVVPYVKTLADVTLEAGEPARAAELYRRAIIIVERVSGAEHSDLAPFLVGLGNALRAQGKLREANTHVARARKVIEGV